VAPAEQGVGVGVTAARSFSLLLYYEAPAELLVLHGERWSLEAAHPCSEQEGPKGRRRREGSRDWTEGGGGATGDDATRIGNGK
jgi:hypothetical protein